MTGAQPVVLLDTSVAVPLLNESHEHHAWVFDVVGARSLGLAGHAVFETYSVLTRMAPPFRWSGTDAAEAIERSFPHSRHLSEPVAQALLRRVGSVGVVGGAVYDALIGAAAAEHNLTLLTRDLRAHASYRAVGATVELLA